MTQETSIDEVKRRYIEQGHRAAAQLNNIALGNYNGAVAARALNWGRPNGNYPKPEVPMAVEAVFDFSDPMRWRNELVQTNRPLTTVDPDSHLPKFPADNEAVEGPVGAAIKDESGKLVPGRYMRSSTDNVRGADGLFLYPPGATYTTKDGKRTFVKVAMGFAGSTQFWQELSK